ncbi:MAG: IS1182 family transposase [Phycisphaerales bacterium]
MNSVPRVARPERHQFVLEQACLDVQLDPDHRVRLVWAFVERADTRSLDARIGSREGGPGAPAIPPKLLLALWLYATLDGVGSAREVERLCRDHAAYRWLCGRVGVNHHTLSDFRGGAGEFLDGLLTQMIACLVKGGIVDGETIHQDGTKVRASAGSKSFRRESTLARLKREAAAHVEKVKRQAANQEESARVRAARQRAADERAGRVDKALLAMAALKQVKARNAVRKGREKPSEARVSTTDPQARVMKTSGSGRAPAYNAQFATDAGSRAIVGVRVVTDPVDHGQSEAMRDDVEKRTGVRVKTHVTDAGYISKQVLEREEAAGVERVMPLPTNAKGEPCVADQKEDGPGVRAWRQRMQTDQAKALLRQRSGIAETPNGELKTYRAMDRLLVRGLTKATAVVLMSAVVYNLMHFAPFLAGRPMSPA